VRDFLDDYHLRCGTRSELMRGTGRGARTVALPHLNRFKRQLRSARGARAAAGAESLEDVPLLVLLSVAGAAVVLPLVLLSVVAAGAAVVLPLVLLSGAPLVAGVVLVLELSVVPGAVVAGAAASPEVVPPDWA
jgi:hypothetical protein